MAVSGSVPEALYLSVPSTFPQVPPTHVTFALTTNVLFCAILLLDNSGGVSKTTDKYIGPGGTVVVVVAIVVVVVTPVVLNMTIFVSSIPIPVTLSSTFPGKADNCTGSRTKVPICFGS